MSDPIRLSKSLGRHAERILSSARDDVPVDGAKDALLASLGLATSGLATASAGAVAAKAGKAAAVASWWSAPLAKAAVIVTIGAATVGTVEAVRTIESRPSEVHEVRQHASTSTPTAARASAPAPTETVSIERLPDAVPTSIVSAKPPTPAKKVVARAEPAVEASEPPPRRVSVLPEELALLDDARGRLASGDARAALALLDDHARRFAQGALSHEAIAMRIDALLKVARTNEATTLAEAFLASHPDSAQAPRVRRSIERASIR